LEKIRDERRKENFVGRGEPIRIFTENLQSDSPDYMVISITGEGGVGKSTLLARFNSIAISPENNAIAIICDDNQTSPVLVMGHIAKKLAEKGITHKEFDERYKKFGELRQELESDPKVPRGGLNLLAMGITDLTIKSLRKTPGVGVFFEYADEKAAGEALAELMQYSISKWGNKDEVRLLREPEQVLTPLFLELVQKAYNNNKIVIMLDVFERTSDSLSSWLLALFSFEYGEFDNRVMYIISRRESLEQHWTQLAGLICHNSLEPFNLEELRLYLSNHNITDDNLINQIYEDTNGLPVLVELLAAAKPTPGIPLPDVSKDAVERFLQWTPQEERRQAVLFAAIPRQFNKDIISAILEEDATTLFNWLSAQSYIRTNSERCWFYHEKVRELMVRYLRHTEPKQLSSIHQKVAAYFQTRQTNLNLQTKDAYENDSWQRLEIERIYSLVAEEPGKHLSDITNAFLYALRWHSIF
jgi:energy-coupling factor transporter ATP-binding protein EcfA2